MSGKHLFKLSIGVKVLFAFFLIIFLIAGGFYHFTKVTLSNEMEHEAIAGLQSKMKGAWKFYHSRLEQMKLGMLQAGSEAYVKEFITRRDSRALNDLISGYSVMRPYVDLWAVVDREQKVIGRRNGITGDFFEIKGLVRKALENGESIISTETISRELLSRESRELARKADPAGVMLVSIVPVENRGVVVGAFVTGILVNRNEYIPDSVLENYQVNSAIFARLDGGTKIISVSSSSDIFNYMTPLPPEVEKAVFAGKPFYDTVTINGRELYFGAEPILDTTGAVIGALSTAISGDIVRHHASHMNVGLLFVTLLAVAFSVVLSFFVYKKTVRPINAISSAMDEIALGRLDARVDIDTNDEFEKIGDGFNRMIESIQVKEARIARFNEVSKILIQSLDPATLLDKALGKIIELTGSNLGIVYLYEEKTGVLKPAAFYGTAGEELKEIRFGDGLAGKCALDQKTIVLQRIAASNFSLDTGFAKVLPSGIVWFAMTCKERLNGVLVMGSLKPYTPDEVNHIEHLVSQIAIALDNALVHKEIERLSISDPLTGLYNKRHFLDILSRAFESSRRHHFSIGIVMIDIDHFKLINDTFGHQAGDKVLIELGNLLKANTRSTDQWARYGGEEFICLLTHCDQAGLEVFCEKLRSSVESMYLSALGRSITVSIGAAYCQGLSGEVRLPEDLIERADANLYIAKSRGRNRSVVSECAAAEDAASA